MSKSFLTIFNIGSISLGTLTSFMFLIFFMRSNSCARAETLNFTIRDFIFAANSHDYHLIPYDIRPKKDNGKLKIEKKGKQIREKIELNNINQ